MTQRHHLFCRRKRWTNELYLAYLMKNSCLPHLKALIETLKRTV